MPSDARGTEVALRRLLHACEAQRSDADWCSSPQARHSVDTAQQYATELAAAGCVRCWQPGSRARCTRSTDAASRRGPRSVPAAALAEYRARAEALSAALRPVPRPAYLRAPVSRAATAAAPPAQRPTAAGASAADSAASLRRRTAPPSADTAATLRRHAALQEDLSDELVDMAAGLKRNALALETGLRDSLRVLDAVEVRTPRWAVMLRSFCACADVGACIGRC
jgi:hypothetical protein